MIDFDVSSAGQRTYAKIISLMDGGFLEVTGTPLQDYSDLAIDERFRKKLNHYLNEIRNNKSASSKLTSELTEVSQTQPILAEMISDGLLSEKSIASENREIILPPDIDDVSPNLFKSACYAEAKSVTAKGGIDSPLNEFLRGVINRVGVSMGWNRRMNIGANRHFPRMAQWLRELEAETHWETGIGFWLLNVSGTGRVREFPIDPSTLKIRIDPAHL